MRAVFAATLLALSLATAAWGQSRGPTVDIVEVAGPLDGSVAGYVTDAVASANARGVAVLVLRLDTPGAVAGDVDALVATVRDSAVPIVVWVGPPGARAYGAGYALARAADVVALAPASALELSGPAGPVIIAVPDGETGVAVPSSAALPPGTDRSGVATLDEAALAERGVADLVASSLPQLLSRLDGLETTRVTLHVDPQTAQVRFVSMGLLDRMLHAVANPTLAYLLLVGGALALAFEIFQPGFGVAGLAGLVVLALGAYGLVVLPVRAGGVALVVVGLLLLAADLARARLGWLTAAGTLAFAAGSWLMFPALDLRPPLWLVVAVTAFCLVFFVLIMTVVLRAQGNQALAGAQSVIGSVGIVRSVLNPEGHVFVRGGLWRARAPDAVGKVHTGTKVRVLGMNDQLTLDIEVVDENDAPATSLERT